MNPRKQSGAFELRVAHCLYGRCNPVGNGVSRAVFHLARHQAQQATAVAVFSTTKHSDLPVIGNVEHFRTDPGWAWGRLAARFPFRALPPFAQISTWCPDIVHFHSVHIGPFIALSAKLRRAGVPYAITPHGGLAPGRVAQMSARVRAYVRLIEQRHFEQAAFVHILNDLEGVGLRSLGFEGEFVVSPFGASPAEPDAGVPPEQRSQVDIERELSLCNGKRLFLFIGRLDPNHKGLDLLLEAFAASHLPDSTLVLAGPDFRGSRKWLAKRIQDLALGDRCRLLDAVYCQQKAALMNRADVFVHTSRWEGAPAAVIEAMAAGLPVLLTRAAAATTEVEAVDAGVVVDATTESIVGALRSLAGLPAARLLAMGERARSLALRNTWEANARALLSAYLEAVGSRRAADSRIAAA